MNNKQEKWFWLAIMIGSWLLALWVTWCMFGDNTANAIHLIGIILICFFTTSCYISTHEYD